LRRQLRAILGMIIVCYLMTYFLEGKSLRLKPKIKHQFDIVSTSLQSVTIKSAVKFAAYAFQI
jgi:hypothetical protein